MDPLFSPLEANQGTLSLTALIATLTLAFMEFRRANKAERARIDEPADAALQLVCETLRLVQEGAKSELLAQEAVRYARTAVEPMKQIARSPTPSARLILALHKAAQAIEYVVPMEMSDLHHDETRKSACKRRTQTLEEAQAALLNAKSAQT